MLIDGADEYKETGPFVSQAWAHNETQQVVRFCRFVLLSVNCHHYYPPGAGLSNELWPFLSLQAGDRLCL